MPAGKWLGVNVTLWGISTACTAAATNYATLLTARIFLGIFEAAIAPALMLISSQWYTKSEQAPRFSFWYCGLGIGQIVGGLVSWGFQQVDSSFEGWRIMFVFLGCLTVVIGFATFFILPDAPMTARFLSDTEKAALLNHVSVNQTGVLNRHFKPSHLLEALLDVQLWFLTLITILISCSSGVITTYSATLVKNIGYKPDTAALLNMPSGIVSIFATLFVGIGIRHIGGGHRWAWLAACCIPGMLGGGLMSFLPSDAKNGNANKAGLVAGIYLVNFIVATLIIIYQWVAANVAGQTKRVFAMALISGAFSVGNIIGPQTFQAKDAPQFIPAKITVLATQGAGALMSVGLYIYYRWTNARRDKKAATTTTSGVTSSSSSDHEKQGGESAAQEQWDNLTDKENPAFRYVY